MTTKKLGGLISASLLVVALVFIAMMGLGKGVDMALAATTQISVKQATLTDPACNPASPNEWHFVITQIDKLSNVPPSITVTWSDNSITVVPLQKYTGGTAHYSAPATGLTPMNATTSIYSTWKGQFNLSHGPCVVLNVSKTATTSFDRKYTWSIDKSVDDDTPTITVGQDSVDAKYSVKVSVDGGTDSNWKVSGTITITNSGPIAATITGAIDDIAAVDCGVSFPYSLAVGSKLNCTYSGALAGAIGGVNHATVSVTQAGATFKAEQAYSFGDPTAVTDECADISDTYAGPLGTLCVADAPKTFEYTRTFTRPEDPADCDTQHSFDNTASFLTNDTGATGSDKQTVNVTAACEMHLAVSKTADTSYDRTFAWAIQKSVDANTLTIPAGQDSVDANYTVSVSVDGGTDSNFKVYGIVTITNDGPIAATITSVDDSVAATDCAVPFNLAVGETKYCNYSLALDAPADGTNNVSVSVSQSASGIGPFTASHDYTFGDPTNYIDECVSVYDNFAGNLGLVCASDAVKSFTYPRTFYRADLAECGVPYSFDNTATSTTNDNGYTDSASQTVIVTAECEVVQQYWCSPGFWAQNSDGLIGTPYDISGILGTPYSAIGGAPLKDGAPADPTIGDVLGLGVSPGGSSVYGGPAFNSVANYISSYFGWTGTQASGENCPIDAHGVWIAG